MAWSWSAAEYLNLPQQLLLPGTDDELHAGRHNRFHERLSIHINDELGAGGLGRQRAVRSTSAQTARWYRAEALTAAGGGPVFGRQAVPYFLREDGYP